GCRLLHFAGHARAGGFQLADGLASPEDVAAAMGARAPRFVFANGCSASTADGWADTARGAMGLASAFLLRGAEHYLAPLWDVPDADALTFALRFYEHALAGVPFGDAVRDARRALAGGPAAPLSFA